MKKEYEADEIYVYSSVGDTLDSCECSSPEFALKVATLLNKDIENSSITVRVGSYVYSVYGDHTIKVSTPNGRDVHRSFSTYSQVKKIVDFKFGGEYFWVFDGDDYYAYDRQGAFTGHVSKPMDESKVGTELILED